MMTHYDSRHIDEFVARFFAPDAVLLLQNRAPIRGRDDLRSKFQADFEAVPERRIAIDIEHIEQSGDLAVELSREKQTFPAHSSVTVLVCDGRFIKSRIDKLSGRSTKPPMRRSQVRARRGRRLRPISTMCGPTSCDCRPRPPNGW